ADAVVGGYGTVGKDVKLDKLWNSPEAANIDIAHVESNGWPVSFLQPYLQENLLARDGHSYECIKTQRAQLWIDIFKRDKAPFNPWTKQGLDPKFVELVFDHRIPLVLRKTHVDQNRLLSDFSLLFRRRQSADQFSRLWEGVVPYLHNALLRVYQECDSSRNGGVPLSSRQQEVLKWVIEGKSNWEIGVILRISERTVKFHVHQLMKKLAATNRPHLVANALANSANAIDL
ncbi:MAG: helix-turn-helix transcriptional regulator, partial [Bdellovibrionota bacterium]